LQQKFIFYLCQKILALYSILLYIECDDVKI